MTGKERILLIVLASINFANIVDFMIMMPLQEYLVPVFHITPFEFSLLVASYSVSAFISSSTASVFADQFDRKKVLMLAFAGFLVGTFGCAFADSYEWLMGSRIVAGLFGGMIGAQVSAIVGDLFTYERRGRAMGALMGAFAFASVIGVPASLWIAKEYGWQNPFLFIALFGVLLFPIVWFIVPKMTRHLLDKKRPGSIYSDVLKDKNTQVGLLMMFTLIFGHFMTIPFIAPYLEINVGLDKDGITLMYLVGGLVSLFAAGLIGKLSDKYENTRYCMFLSFSQ